MFVKEDGFLVKIDYVFDELSTIVDDVLFFNIAVLIANPLTDKLWGTETLLGNDKSIWNNILSCSGPGSHQRIHKNSTNAFAVYWKLWSLCRISLFLSAGCESNSLYSVQMTRLLVIWRSVMPAAKLRSWRSTIEHL